MHACVGGTQRRAGAQGETLREPSLNELLRARDGGFLGLVPRNEKQKTANAVVTLHNETQHHKSETRSTPSPSHLIHIIPAFCLWQDMGRVQSPYIAGALLPGALVAVLFYFDHNVSAQLASQQEFGLVKPPAYHWDMLLLGERGAACRIKLAHKTIMP